MTPATTEKIKKFPNGDLAGWVKIILQFAIVPVLVILLLHDRQITSIEASRFTAADGQKVYEKLAEVNMKLAALPPDVFENKVDAIAQSVGDARTQIGINTAKLVVIESEIRLLREIRND